MSRQIGDTHYLLIEWAKWKNCTPRYDREKSHAAIREAFGSRVPPNVWFTPCGILHVFQTISDGYKTLPDVQHLAIKRLYIYEEGSTMAARLMGISRTTLEVYRRKACSAIAEVLDDELPHRHEGSNNSDSKTKTKKFLDTCTQL